MTDKEKIREEVEKIAKSINLFAPDEDGKNSSYEEGRLVVASQILQIIDSLQEESVSEDLEEAAKRYAQKVYPDEQATGLFGTGDYEPHIDKSPLRDSAIEDFVAGAKWQIAKLMKKATEVTVHIDAGGYPYTPEIELYDYDKDVPLAKEGDKYKVVLIKED